MDSSLTSKCNKKCAQRTSLRRTGFLWRRFQEDEDEDLVLFSPKRRTRVCLLLLSTSPSYGSAAVVNGNGIRLSEVATALRCRRRHLVDGQTDLFSSDFVGGVRGGGDAFSSCVEVLM